MKAQLSTKPFFVFLLPLFFVLHGYTNYSAYLQWQQLIPLLLIYLAASAVLYLLFKLLVKHPVKAGLMTVYCMGFFFFFGALFDFLKLWSPWKFLYKYSVLLPVFLALALLLFVWFRRSNRSFFRITLFLNVLFLLFIVFDLINLGRLQWVHRQKISKAGLVANNAVVARPDIYLLLYDEYSGNQALKQWFRYDNSGLDSFLHQRGFYIPQHSQSNYNSTVYSMASMLNMEYPEFPKHNNRTLRDDIYDCTAMIRNNKAGALLTSYGYQTVNVSIFDLANHPAPVNQRFLAVSTRLITQETFLSRFSWDCRELLLKYSLLRKIFPVYTGEDQIANNQRCVDLTIEASAQKNTEPKFVYSHLLIPHSPYFFDKNGNRRSGEILYAKNMQDSAAVYLGYLEYCNGIIKKMVSNIQDNTKGNAVILVMSDHGLRWMNDPRRLPLVYNNLNAVYLPGSNYSNWPSEITNVNQFRILFNDLFAQKFPLLKDSFILIK